MKLLNRYRAWRERRAFDRAMRQHAAMILRTMGERLR